MNYKLFNDTMLNIIEKLKNNNSVKLIEHRYNPDEPTQDDIDWVIEEIKDLFNIILPDYMQIFIVQDNSIICWHYNLENSVNKPGGEFFFCDFGAHFVDTTETAFADTLTPYGTKLYKQGYRFFDSQPNAGAGNVTALKLENGTVAPKVYFIDLIHEDILEMEIGYPEYIDHSLKLKGLYDWQYLFCDIDFKGLDFDISPLKERLNHYKIIFPDIDITEYIKRYNERYNQS
jgi:hypothetical protein